MQALTADGADEAVLLELRDAAKPLDPLQFADLLDIACRRGKERDQYLLLEFARYHSVPLSPKAGTCIAELIRSESKRVRAHAFGPHCPERRDGPAG